MKFRFCGDADCPNWLLMQINTLSALSLDNFKIVCQAVAESLQGTELDYKRMNELGKEAKLDMVDLKACISGVAFTFRSGTKYGVQSNELGAELEQLGLEESHAKALVSIYSQCYDGLRKSAVAATLRRPGMKDLEFNAVPGGVTMKFNTKEPGDVPSKTVAFNMSSQQAHLLLQELKTIANRMGSISGN